MKWFKHFTTAMDDLFVKDIERKFGDTGYAFWFKTLELIGAHGQAGKLSISWANYLDKLHKSRTKAEELLSFCQTNAKLSFTDDGETINIECRKFAEIADNYTKYDGASTKRLQRQSKVSTKQEVEEDKEVEGEEEKIYEGWNLFADLNGLSKIVALSNKRKTCVRQRLKESLFNLPKILAEISASDFLKGSTGWKCDFDFVFCSANNYLKILEGKYRNGNGIGSRQQVSPATARATHRVTEERIEQIRREQSANFREPE